jgi:hypothetical protein
MSKDTVTKNKELYKVLQFDVVLGVVAYKVSKVDIIGDVHTFDEQYKEFNGWHEISPFLKNEKKCKKVVEFNEDKFVIGYRF